MTSWEPTTKSRLETATADYIHKRCLKLLYSDRTQRWNWHEKLQRTPVLYGCCNDFKEEFFNLYKILRLRCTPQHQDEDAPGFASISRQNRRRLRKTGLLRFGEETMKERCAGKMLETWRWMENRQVRVWIDNCYIKQYGTHPTIQDQSQNCTALCVVGIPCRLPYFRGHPNIDVLIGSIGSVAAALVRMKRSFHGIVTDLGLLADRPAAIPSIRAPLDILGAHYQIQVGNRYC